MVIHELDDDGGMLARAIRVQRAAEAKRTGLHLSTVVDDMVATMFPLRRGELPDATVLALQEIGNGIEDAVAAYLRTIAGWTKPPTRTCNGITCSPDGFSARSGTIDEMKATWSQWTSKEEFFGTPKATNYLIRIKGYCYVWGVTRARLHVCFVRGARGGAPLPITKTFILRFTSDEPAVQWRAIRGHARDRRML